MLVIQLVLHEEPDVEPGEKQGGDQPQILLNFEQELNEVKEAHVELRQELKNVEGPVLTLKGSFKVPVMKGTPVSKLLSAK